MAVVKTPLYETHITLSARMAPFGGWDMPIQYKGILVEHEQTRRRASVFDTCHMGEFILAGPTAEADLDRLLTMRVSTLAQGQCRYGYLLNDEGGVLDDLTCYRFGSDCFMLVVNAGTLAQDSAWIRAHLSRPTNFLDLSEATAKLDIQGPDSRAAMEAASGERLPDLKYFHFVQMDWMEMPCLISRTGYTGEWGYEIYFPAAQAVRTWEVLTASGRITPAGLGARDTLRLEMAYPLYGHELSADRTPVAASRGMFIDTAKEFIGKAAVVRDVEHGVSQYLVGLRLKSRAAGRAQDPVVAGGRVVGRLTSGSLAPSLGVAVALAYLDTPLCEPGRTVDIEIRGRPLPAEVVALPFYREGTARGVKKTS